MKRLLALLAVLLFATVSFATTTVTGHIANLDTSKGTGFVRFWLRGCAGNQPTVPAVGAIQPTRGAVWYVDLPADSNGNVAGTIFSTRDSTGSGNGEIECAGSFLAVWYGMQFWAYGMGGPEIPIHAKIGATIDISTVTPISVTPVVPAPTGDNTYCRLDGGNGPCLSAATPVDYGVKNATSFPGADIGEKINAAQASCSGGDTCTVWVQQGSYSYSTTIVLQKGVILACASRVNADSGTLLNYTGSGDAVSIPDYPDGYGTQIQNCGWVIGNAAACGINNHGYRTIIDNVYLTGGSNTTTLVHVKGNIQQYKGLQLWNATGIGIECDNAIDTFFTDADVFGTSNTTAGTAGIILDSGCRSLHINTMSGGSANYNGMVIRDTINPGNPPSQLFVRDYTSDCSASDGILFDSSLGAQLVQATFTDSWAAGAGENCTDNTTINAHKAGVHISGGAGINFVGGKYRANTGSGFLIDSTNVQDVSITGAQILSNNLNNDGTESGIDVTAASTGLVVIGNTITNAIDFRGSQKYGVNIAANVPWVRLAANIIYSNATADFNLASGIVYANDSPFRMMIPTGATGIYTYVQSDSDISEYSWLGYNQAKTNPYWFITKGGNGFFMRGLQLGQAGAVSGQIQFYGATSNVATLSAQAAAGTPSLALPTTSGTLVSNSLSPLSIDGTTGEVSCPTCTITSGTPTSGKATCWKSATAIGYCSSQPDSVGACTCN